jgi:hypothetical protein
VEEARAHQRAEQHEPEQQDNEGNRGRKAVQEMLEAPEGAGPFLLEHGLPGLEHRGRALEV